MSRQISLGKGSSVVLCLWLVLLSGLSAYGAVAEKKKGLFYYVVDRSASIATNRLTDPISQAITEHAAQLPEETEVRLVFFSRRASESKRWTVMTPEAKADFAGYFADKFFPDGPTRLYDTVGEVLEELRAAEDDYRFVSVLVFSDGANNWSQKFKTWRDLEPVYGELENRHEQSFIYWITLGFEPRDPAVPWVHHEPQPPGSKEIPIPEPAPQAEFTAYPRQLKVGEEIRFEHVAKGGRVDQFEWHFGDGNGSSDQDPVHQYESDGIYSVTLRTTGPGGNAEEVKRDLVRVLPDVPLRADFRTEPERLQKGDTLHLQDASEGKPEKLEWRVNGEPFSAEPSVVVLLEEAGDVMIDLTVTRGEETDTASRTVTVLPPPPSAVFDIDLAEADIGDTITLSAGETDGHWQHVWTIDGEIELKGHTVEWESDRSGLLSVTHAVEGPGGLSRHSDRIFIHPAVEFVPETGFSIAPRFFTEGENVVFKAKETGDSWKHEWIVDGETLGEGAEWEWATDRTGNLSVTHRVRVPDTEEVFEESDEVLGKAHDLVQVAFSTSVDSGTYPLEVHFEDESVGEAVAYRWDFGDGNTSNQRNPTHVYREAGEYPVTLAATNPQGETTVSVEPAVLSVAAPMPLWQKIVIGAIVASLVWVLIVVPLILRPLLAPQKGPKLVGIRTYPLYVPARRRWSRFIWPRTGVTVGSALSSDIRLPANGSSRGNHALIERSPAGSTYRIRPIKEHEIYKIEQRTSLMDPDNQEKARVTGSRTLKDGDTLEIAGERFTWHQPKARSAKRVSKKRKRLATAKN